MRALGIVLVVFNLLAGGAFTYLAVRDWKGRQEITAAGLRNYLVLAGLPLGDRPGDPLDMPPDNPEEPPEVPFYIEMQGGVPTKTVGYKVLAAYFQGAGGGGAATDKKELVDAGTLNNKPVQIGPPKDGAAVVGPLGGTNPVPNQLAEVKRVRGVVKANVDKAKPEEKPALLGSYLLYQMETYEGRVNVLRLIQDGNADALQKALDARFDRVTNPPVPTAAGTKDTPLGALRDSEDRRAAVAHLLVHLDQDGSWQKRVAMVVGLRRYVVAVATQAVRMADMATRVQAQIYTDSKTFEREYMQLEEVARDRTGVLADLRRERAALERQRDRARAEVAAITTQLEGSGDVKGLRRLLQEVRAEVDGMVAQQAQIEGRLFDVQKEIGLTLESIYDMEARVDRLERERYGKKD